MADLEEVLETETFKNQCDGIAQRVFHTLTDELENDPQKVSRRVANVLAGLLERLAENGVVSDGELDTLLLECRGYPASPPRSSK